jgi:hypothetical protein
VTAVRLPALAPLPPRLDAMHGGGRATAGPLAGLSGRCRLALFALRVPGMWPTDGKLRAYGAVPMPLAADGLHARGSRAFRLAENDDAAFEHRYASRLRRRRP